jgi:phosphatidylinositol phospholipase C delta
MAYIAHKLCASSQSPELVMSLDGFTSFLLSSDNSAFIEQQGKVWHDMTRPLSEYLISSSHNTYLIGHQLVGSSTIEGYIRALLHSCRSVESECNLIWCFFD